MSSFSESMSLFLFCKLICIISFQLSHGRAVIYFSFSVWLTSPSRTLSRSLHVAANGNWVDFRSHPQGESCAQSGLRQSWGTFLFLLTVSVLLRAKANMGTSPPSHLQNSVGGFLLLFTHWEGPFLEGSQIFRSF